MSAANGNQPDVDVVVVGAGFAGLYLLHRLREKGLTAQAYETGGDVGGTWFWNRYPGARCDVQSMDYSYSFDPELEQEWQWSEKYATQPEILRYLNHVADKYDLRRDVQFSTRVTEAAWSDESSVWQITTDQGDSITARHYVMATGCLSAPKTLDIEGVEQFGGEVYYTSRWPHEPVDLTGKRVAVIGTGSSGIQSIPLMAKQAGAMTIYQRTPNFSIPALNGPIPQTKLDAIGDDYQGYREQARWSRGGVPAEISMDSALAATEEERQARFEKVWETGELFAILSAYGDLMISTEANDTLCDFIRNKIRTIVKDPKTAEALCPTDHPFGTKRPCLDSGYYETFNLPHVNLVDLRKNPITTITKTGIDTTDGSQEFDVIVFATGFDAMTGAIVAVDIKGRNGVELKDKWADGPTTYLGLTVTDFPNFFAITGPGSPSVLSNMAVSIEQHVDWVADCVEDMRQKNMQTIEPTELAQQAWVQHVNDAGGITLYPKANSWYMGANVPGKPRVFLPFVGGVDAYRKACNEVVEREYLGFELTGDGKAMVNDGIIRPLQPDVTMVLDMMAELNLPPLESMTPDEARAFSVASSAERPPGPEVGEIIDGTFPGADGELNYRLYRPDTEGPHPIVAYFHGGGWVLGSHDSDDPFCRDLCVRSNAIIISADYRHAPEHRFPAAADDAYAAVQWMADNAEALGGLPGQLAVSGWSAGGNIAAVACQTARHNGGPTITGQLLVTPVTDSDMTRSSYSENADGFILTKALMDWFWDHYIDPADRNDPRVAPIKAADLSNLPPAHIITCQFDPLRDEGIAYAEALAAAGVDATVTTYRGHIHTSLTAVDMILTGVDARAEMGEALQRFFGASVPA